MYKMNVRVNLESQAKKALTNASKKTVTHLGRDNKTPKYYIFKLI